MREVDRGRPGHSGNSRHDRDPSRSQASSEAPRGRTPSQSPGGLPGTRRRRRLQARLRRRPGRRDSPRRPRLGPLRRRLDRHRRGLRLLSETRPRALLRRGRPGPSHSLLGPRPRHHARRRPRQTRLPRRPGLRRRRPPQGRPHLRHRGPLRLGSPSPFGGGSLVTQLSSAQLAQEARLPTHLGRLFFTVVVAPSTRIPPRLGVIVLPLSLSLPERERESRNGSQGGAERAYGAAVTGRGVSD
mmetsp:Transcript_17907/g.56174  ORF Transcript_17907/g.56174 Transcript_17907/m.56174 type:complete len:243 (+) Transcript_17907:1545-2273(+)